MSEAPPARSEASAATDAAPASEPTTTRPAKEEKSPTSADRRRGSNKDAEEEEDEDKGNLWEDILGSNLGSLEKELAKVDEDYGVWKETLMDPLDIRFSQENIHPFFFRRGPVKDVVPEIRSRVYKPTAKPAEAPSDSDLLLVPPFPSIRILHVKGDDEDTKLTLDNRRLYALQQAAIRRFPWKTCVRVHVTERLPRKKRKTEYRKLNSQTRGMTVQIASRNTNFERWDWIEAMVEAEAWWVLLPIQSILFGAKIAPLVLAGCHAYLNKGKLHGSVPFLRVFFWSFLLDILWSINAVVMQVSRWHVRSYISGWAISCPLRREPPGRPARTSAAYLLVVVILIALVAAPYFVLSLPETPKVYKRASWYVALGGLFLKWRSLAS
mmetsp:Transcript_84487/g.225760  ORF Transcript_84487/g.225760 Transcript_84487/m.225760 type:complete len:382 (+) Transcript_84487:104-1249(+)